MSSPLVQPPPRALTRRERSRHRARANAARRRAILCRFAPVTIPRPAAKPERAGLGMVASVLAHGALAGSFAVYGVEPEAPKAVERWVMVTPPPAPKPVVEPAGEPKPVAPPKPTPKPRRKRQEPKTEVAAVSPKPAAPVAEPVAPVVGLNFESTVTGGSGPSVAVGSTQMGRTAERAAEPNAAPESASFNRKASVRPGPGGNLVLPARLEEIKPDYPADLRALGVEANVVVRVQIDARGRVTQVRLVQRADDDAFNRSARNAARRERFSPATLNGVATDYHLSFTYRFRLDA